MAIAAPPQTQNTAEQIEVENFTASAVAKVQLDVEGAPFLQEDIPPPAVAESKLPNQEASTLVAPEVELGKQKKKKRIIIIGAIAFCVIVTGLVGWFFLLRPTPPAITPPQTPPTVVVVPSPDKITGPAEIAIKFEPFWLPQKSVDSQTYFLKIHFSAITENEKVAREITDKMIILRDAVYYYLRNKTHAFLLATENMTEIKQDILNVINSYVVQGKLEYVLFENYLVR